jgi:hypothetical protein
VKESEGQRVAIIGLSEPPAGMDYLPHLKSQLAGVRIVPPAESLAQWLPKAKAEADDVVLLYYGSAAGAKKLADAFGKDLAAILVGGARPEELPQGTAAPLVAAEEHGKSLARLTLGAKGPAEQIAIDDSLAADPAMVALLANAASAPAPSPAGTSPATAAADAKGDAGPAETEAPVARPLVQVEVKPLEPAPARPAEQPAPQTASAEKSAPPAAPEITPESAADQPTEAKPTGGTGVLDFLKSLVSGTKTGAAAAAKQRTSAQPEAKRASPVQTVEPAAEQASDPAAEPAAPPQQPAKQPQRAAAASTGPKYCTNCGAKLQPNAKFCTNCGARVKR